MSIFGLKQASRNWNIHFDHAIKYFVIDTDEPCMYKKCERNVMMFLILYIYSIILIGNDVRVLSIVKI